ncbi:GAP family protein [Xanthobacter sp. TB0139]|uniref:GAP family protein n=1 Tax=Xanthobacter sp. TB0139 TaxID=3459178 RepID=UPI00403A2D84
MMTTNLLDVFTHGLGVAISPLVIIALVMILLSPRAKENGIAFLAGWLFGLGALGGVIFMIGGLSGMGHRPVIHGALALTFGLLLFALALRSWGHRKDKQETSRWLSAADHFTPLQAGAAGCFFAAIYPKNLILTAAMASKLAETASPQRIEDYGLFIVIGSLTIAGPVVLYLLAGKTIQPRLDRSKDWLVQHSRQILIALLCFFGARLSIRGLLLLTGGG